MKERKVALKAKGKTVFYSLNIDCLLEHLVLIRVYFYFDVLEFLYENVALYY